MCQNTCNAMQTRRSHETAPSRRTNFISLLYDYYCHNMAALTSAFTQTHTVCCQQKKELSLKNMPCTLQQPVHYLHINLVMFKVSKTARARAHVSKSESESERANGWGDVCVWSVWRHNIIAGGTQSRCARGALENVHDKLHAPAQ